jgi:hypothetical protein
MFIRTWHNQPFGRVIGKEKMQKSLGEKAIMHDEAAKKSDEVRTGESRNPSAEMRMKAETRSPKLEKDRLKHYERRDRLYVVPALGCLGRARFTPTG